jgi:outer membrane protein assembly factor BamB
MRAKPQAIDAKVLGDGTVAWATWYGGTYATDPRTRYEIRSFDGKRVRQLKTVGTVTDHHELQELANGNYMVTSYRPRSGVDAMTFNGDADATVLDAVVQEVTPKGKLVYEWSSADHIALAETGRWWTYTFGFEPYDHVHINAVDPLANGDFLVSLHNTDAVYRIDRETGNVVWKLGGTPTAQSLNVVGDPQAYTLAGQHDVRDIGQGEISIFDNGTLTANPARVVRFRIDGSTATLLEAQHDPQIPYSNCCGSAEFGREDGSWLISWGGTRFVTEVDGRDRRTFTLEFSPDHIFSYRAHAVDGLVSLRELRAGMRAQVPDAR